MSTIPNENICGLKREDFQTTINGKRTDLYVLRNALGNEVAITNYGGAIVAIMVPDRDGKYANIIQGHDNINDVINSPEPYLSRLIGRFGNRIANGKFQLHGKEYCLPINNGPNSLHGGIKGFNIKVWDAELMNDRSLVLHYVSAYGEEGFSGELKTTVIYTFNDDNELVIDYLACTNKKTIINLTHHAFFSLAGIANPTPTVDNLECEINADFYLPIDKTSIPTGEILKVEDTPFDFRTPMSIGKRINEDNEQLKNGSGYDHCYVLNKKEEGELSFAARITEPNSGRTMEMYTTEPGVQLYTGNFENGIKGTHGATYPYRSGICFEAQHFPPR
ncbi:MAG: aldose epimerase family protein [Segatella maculosa]